MNSTLRKFTILQRLILMLALAALGTLSFASFNIKEQYTNLETQKWQQNDGQLDTVLSIIAAHQRQVEQGQLSLEQAKSQMAQLLTAVHYGNGGYFVIIDDANRVIATSENTLNAGTELNDKPLLDLVKEARRSLKATMFRETHNPVNDQTTEQLTEGRFYEPWKWTVITGAFVTDIHDAMKTAIWHTFIIMMLISTPLFALFMALNHSISSPLESAIMAMENIADGEGDLRARLDTAGKDEIARLAVAFNHFAEKISILVKDIKPMGVELANDAEALTSAVTTTQSSAERIYSETENVATAIHQMLTTSQDMAKNTQHAADCACKVTSQAKETQELMTLTLVQTEKLVEKLRASESTTARLSAASGQIGSILDVIRAIAEQTNLLALNAAIEAARAGSHGRGFAVVADEVRALANRTQDSTNEINKIINDIQSGIVDVTNSNKANQGLSESLQASAHSAGIALEDILLLTANINDINNQLASATEEQTLVTEEINRNVTNISAQMQLAVQSNDGNSHAAQNLNTISSGLTQALSRFRV